MANGRLIDFVSCRVADNTASIAPWRAQWSGTEKTEQAIEKAPKPLADARGSGTAQNRDREGAVVKEAFSAACETMERVERSEG